MCHFNQILLLVIFNCLIIKCNKITGKTGNPIQFYLNKSLANSFSFTVTLLLYIYIINNKEDRGNEQRNKCVTQVTG